MQSIQARQPGERMAQAWSPAPPQDACPDTCLFSRFDSVEASWCVLINRGSHRSAICRLFTLVSRLGDGIFWYALLALAPWLYGFDGIPATLHMGVLALVNVVLYKSLKARLVRERPYVSYPAIRCGTPPLDRGSFPSGHSLHAAAFGVLVIEYMPELAWVVIPFAVLVALSRVILGLHYPSDVAAGAALGGGLAAVSLYLLDGIVAVPAL